MYTNTVETKLLKLVNEYVEQQSDLESRLNESSDRFGNFQHSNDILMQTDDEGTTDENNQAIRSKTR
jgi:hypothetical protein